MNAEVGEDSLSGLEPERKFGVVVVGVGRAGSVRIRDLRNPHASSAFLNLIGFVSRRELGNIDEVQQISLEDALSSQEVEVAYICSESSSHADYIRQFLNAGKHVLVEYPMTLSWAEAQDLWTLAEQKGDVYCLSNTDPLLGFLPARCLWYHLYALKLHPVSDMSCGLPTS
ncbi:biliverdin reductase A-like isoform X2 [Vulpes lagopus]|uniref:biliverdin reductase A-like isoform X2 n=1 Tax=Vulpes lagopus TaxID=494514 RepID=UPI001BC9E534|nr:biliverdin reductase A-like isoform X2 [Vulpes lagopus]XP_041578225.1 biliverdin reductase A-like isoform X2 [Vulpes lagopus]